MSLSSIEEEAKEKKAMEDWEKQYGKPKEEEKTDEKKDEKKDDSALDLEPKPDEKKPDDKPPEEKKDEPEVKLPETVSKTEYDALQHKFDVLKGKYDAEVPRFAFDLAEANKRLEKLEKEKPEEKPKPEPKDDTLKKFKEEYPEVYEGTSSLVDTMIKEKLSKVDKIEEKIGKVEEKTEKVKVESDRGLYLGKLDADQDVGRNWRTINEDPEFKKWIQEEVPYAGGLKRYDFLMDSWNKMEPDNTLKFFKDFNALSKAAPKKDEKKVKDDDLHPPKGQKGADNRKSDETPTVTMEEWKKFTRDVIDGKWKGREADADKEEQRLIKGLGIKIRQT